MTKVQDEDYRSTTQGDILRMTKNEEGANRIRCSLHTFHRFGFSLF